MKTFASISVSMCLVACGGSSANKDNGTGSSGSPQRATATQTVSSSQGASVAVDDGRASIEIAPNALAQDTEVTLSVAPASDYQGLGDTMGSVVILEPAGTHLSVPANLQIDAGGRQLQQSEIAQVVRMVDGEWAPLGESGIVIVNGKVRVEVSDFTPVAVRVTAPTGSVQVGVYDRFERTLSNVPVELLSGETVLSSGQTGSEGSVTLDNIRLGMVTVKVTPPLNCANDPTEQEVTVTANQTAHQFFMFDVGTEGSCPP